MKYLLISLIFSDMDVSPVDSTRIARQAIAQVSISDPCSIGWIIFIILLAGLLGGSINFLFYYTPKTTNTVILEKSLNEPVGYILNCIVVGVGAAFLVPLLLYLLRSELLKNIFVNCDTSDRFVLFSFCLLAAISAFRFIPALSDKIFELLKRVETVEQKTNQATHKSIEAIKIGEDAKKHVNKAVEEVSQTQAVVATVYEDLTKKSVVIQAIKEAFRDRNPIKTRLSAHAVVTSEPVLTNLNKTPTNPDDPQKDRWGGESNNGTRKVTAIVTPLDEKGDWCKIDLTVDSVPEEQTVLNGEVIFFLHPSFSNRQISVEAQNGKAELSMEAWGAFTIGVWLSTDQTSLEIDLASNEVNAPEPFRSN